MSTFLPHIPSRTERAIEATYAVIDRLHECIVGWILLLIHRTHTFLFDESVSRITPTGEALSASVSPVVQEPDIAPEVQTIPRSVAVDALGINDRVYVRALCAIRPLPQVEFDSIVGVLQYGDECIVENIHDEYVRVRTENLSGWVLRKHLSTMYIVSCADFIQGETYHAHHPCTIHVRSFLNDPFSLSDDGRMLEPGEYVLYMWAKEGKYVAWPPLRPRLSGSWHRILDGSTTTLTSLVPSEGAIMEYMDTEGRGHLAYVISVRTDTSLCVGEVGEHETGVYTEHILSVYEWNEREPVFISNAMFARDK